MRQDLLHRLEAALRETVAGNRIVIRVIHRHCPTCQHTTKHAYLDSDFDPLCLSKRHLHEDNDE